MNIIQNNQVQPIKLKVIIMTISITSGMDSWNGLYGYRPIDNPSDRYSKDPIYDLATVSGTVTIVYPSSSFTSSWSIGPSTVPFSFKNIKVEEPKKVEKPHIQIDIIPILRNLSKLEIADEA